jgi:hypothetical protein
VEGSLWREKRKQSQNKIKRKVWKEVSARREKAIQALVGTILP